MKKIVSVILVLLMAVLLFAACGENTSGKNVNVTVCDENGKPVAGVKVQACDDTVCMVSDTDASGTAGFSVSKKAVDIQILKVPEGFAPVDDVFRTDASGKLAVTLKPAA